MPKPRWITLRAAAMAVVLSAALGAWLWPLHGDASSLEQALRNAVPGDVIEAPGGDQGTLSIDGLRFDAPVTLRAADPANPPVLRTMRLRNVRNIVLEGLVFDHVPGPGDDDRTQPFEVRNSESVIIRDAVFDGARSGVSAKFPRGLGAGHGLYIRESRDVTVERSRFFDWKRAAVFDRVEGLIVRGNDVHAIRSDGFDFVAVRNTVIEANHLHDFEGDPENGDHRDMIQFWSAGSSIPSVDVTIRGNFLDSGQGINTQSIFIRNETAERAPERAEDMAYRRFVIEDNLIRNGHLHGITISGMRDVVIRRNTLLQDGDAGLHGSVSLPRINIRGMVYDLELTDNIAPEILFAANAHDRGVTETGTVIAQRAATGRPNHYDVLFVDGLSDGDVEGWDPAGLPLQIAGLPPSARASLPGLQARPDGAAATAGSPLSRLPGLLRGWIDMRPGIGLNAQSRSFDAALIDGTPPGADTRWRFGDGTAARGGGPGIAHAYETAGPMRVIAQIETGDGRSASLARTVMIDALEGLRSDFTTGQGPTALMAASRLDPERGLRMRDAPGPGGLSYGRDRAVRDLDAFTLAAQVRIDGAKQGGTLVYYLGGIVLSVGETGVDVRLTLTRRRQIRLRASARLNDGRPHRVMLTFSGRTGEAQLFVDGKAGKPVTGLEGARFAGSSSHDFRLGHPRKIAFGGLVERFAFFRAAITPAETAALLD